ncbi:MAG: HAD hydrolase-like protein [Actinomycetota bacterium]
MWMVGDNVTADVRGAEAVGIPAILVRTEDGSVARRAQDLYGIRALLVG